MNDNKAGQVGEQRTKCFRSRMMTAFDLLRKENNQPKLHRK